MKSVHSAILLDSMESLPFNGVYAFHTKKSIPGAGVYDVVVHYEIRRSVTDAAEDVTLRRIVPMGSERDIHTAYRNNNTAHLNQFVVDRERWNKLVESGRLQFQFPTTVSALDRLMDFASTIFNLGTVESPYTELYTTPDTPQIPMDLVVNRARPVRGGQAPELFYDVKRSPEFPLYRTHMS